MASPCDYSRQQPRINVTFRWLRVHKLQCPLARVAREAATISSSKTAAVCSPALGWKSAADKVLQASHTNVGAQAGDSQNSSDTEKQRKAQQAAAGGKMVSKYFQIVDAVTNEPVSRLDRLAEGRDQWLARAEEEGAIVASPLPKSARPLFGMGARSAPIPRPGGATAFSLQWPQDTTAKIPQIKWQACDNCGHTCYGGGRACKEGEDAWSGAWFCRCCWQSWAVEAPAGGAQAVGWA